MEKHPADETKLSVALNVVIPSLVSVAILIASIIVDLHDRTGTWTQRSGNTLIVVGAYIGYHEAKKAIQVIDSDLYFNPELWYKVVAIALVLIGTVVSGYGDIIVRAIA